MYLFQYEVMNICVFHVMHVVETHFRYLIFHVNICIIVSKFGNLVRQFGIIEKRTFILPRKIYFYTMLFKHPPLKICIQNGVSSAR
jgi:hypothetical protein